MNESLVLRTEARPRDRVRIREITRATEMFHAPEIEVAVELVDDRLAKGDGSDYVFLFADSGSLTLGYACYGWNSMTQSSWDLYWIAVDPGAQGRGIGRALLDAVEVDVRARRGSRLYVETSGRAQYEPTRGFYLASGYTIAAELPHFYAPGDSKVIFVKSF
jgi:ribosomal protein S18 acetylase RimI-like enzyme